MAVEKKFSSSPLGSRGQAAVTDSFYFLMIVTGLCILLFSYSSNYGVSIDSSLARKYTSDFATDALKTFLYSSTPRNPANSIYDSGIEIDHLLAYIKEDYYQRNGESLKKNFSPEVEKVIQSSISRILSPVSDSSDYLLTFSIPTSGEYIFVLLHLSNYSISETFSEGKLIGTVALGSPPKGDLFCNRNNALTQNKIRDLLARAGRTVQSSAIVLLPTPTETNLKAQVDLIMWTPSTISPDASKSNLEYYKAEWDCVDI